MIAQYGFPQAVSCYLPVFVFISTVFKFLVYCSLFVTLCNGRSIAINEA